MKKLLFLILAALTLTFIVAGCGGGGDNTPHFLTAILHVIDNTGNGIAGVKFVYSDPDHHSITSPVSGSDGIIRITINKYGDYYITSYEYGGNHSLPTPYPIHVNPEDLDGRETDIFVTMDPDTGEITIDDGDDDDSPTSMDVTLHFQLQNGSPIQGLQLGYTLPGGSQEIKSAASNEDGNIFITLTIEGNYTVKHVYLEGVEHTLNPPQVIPFELDSESAVHTIILDSNGQIVSIDGE